MRPNRLNVLALMTAIGEIGAGAARRRKIDIVENLGIGLRLHLVQAISLADLRRPRLALSVSSHSRFLLKTSRGKSCCKSAGLHGASRRAARTTCTVSTSIQ